MPFYAFIPLSELESLTKPFSASKHFTVLELNYVPFLASKPVRMLSTLSMFLDVLGDLFVPVPFCVLRTYTAPVPFRSWSLSSVPFLSWDTGTSLGPFLSWDTGSSQGLFLSWETGSSFSSSTPHPISLRRCSNLVTTWSGTCPSRRWP